MMRMIRYFKGHRIQTGRAIISLVIRNEVPLIERGSIFAEWTGDAYELRAELNTLIAEMEAKEERRKRAGT